MLKFSLCVYFDFRNSFTSHKAKATTQLGYQKKEQKFFQERKEKREKKLPTHAMQYIAWRLHFVNFNSPFYLSLNLYFSVSAV